ncbi:glycosyltransferase [Nitratireductor aquimarinus]|uniref:glycosyltransferase n=1 Tax=Nitratireductor TaxID=245876 RepID=UPI0019D40FEC|nr:MULTISPECIES: glycosyltransferase [Nitratireductor]MBN7777454.1 glycosyltransferase [Nitratireductor pacificus]MBN7781447.1 glycosyltransferase [Nitratireductor pacificus]MBN7790253.1 glycosyltransferase [Nitratireductor aquimarinus]MBY6099663.1 glycosyltransferase [Nitratireductor aquimarinus]MCA1261754.1 glycosyltransferase [Nitratireductor aquimarinus]
MLSLERAGVLRWRLLQEHSWDLNDIRGADVVIFCRNQSVDAYSAVLLAKHEGKKIIYEVDDNFFEIPLNTSLAEIHRRPIFLHTMRRFFELADVTRVYSAKMADLALSFGAKVHHTKAYFDDSIIKDVPIERSSDKIRIAFASGRSPDPLTEQALEQAIIDIIKTHPKKVEVHYWRSPSSLLRGYPQVKVNAGTADYNNFIRKFYASGYDIGLAPLLDTVFYQSKTNSKYREYGGCGVAGVYSNVAPYTDCVKSDLNGIIVDNTYIGWRNAILKLVENESLRQSIAANALADVKEKYSYNGFVKDWYKSLQIAINAPSSKPKLKPLLFHRNLAISKRAVRAPLGSPKNYQIKSIRGAEWSNASYFITNFIKSFGSSRLLEGQGVVNWAVADVPKSIDATSLRTMYQAGIRIICDVRDDDRQTIVELIDRLASCAKDVAIVICNPDQFAVLGGTDKQLLARVEHIDYPRPQSFPCHFGYAIVAPLSRPLLDEASLSGQEGLWLEVLDTMSIFHEMGRPVGPKIPRWRARAPIKYQRGFQLLLSPRNVLRSFLARGSSRFEHLRWEQLRWMLKSDAEVEEQIRQHISHYSSLSTSPEKID